MSQRVLVCSLLEGRVLAVRGKSGGTADVRPAILAFWFPPEMIQFGKFVLSAMLRSVDG